MDEKKVVKKKVKKQPDIYVTQDIPIKEKLCHAGYTPVTITGNRYYGTPKEYTFKLSPAKVKEILGEDNNG